MTPPAQTAAVQSPPGAPTFTGPVIIGLAVGLLVPLVVWSDLIWPVLLALGAGLLLISLLTIRLSVLLYSSVRRLQFESVQTKYSAELWRHRIALAKAQRVEAEAIQASWNGFRKFKVERKVDEGGDICSFYLVPHDKKPLPTFKPGQYLTFQLRIPAKEKPVIRCYSLSEAPLPGVYRVSIKRVPAPRGREDVPPGLGSNYFHDNVWEGDLLDVRAPAGKFFLDMHQDDPVVLIGGGVGITPVLSMLNAIVETGSKRETWFFLGVRNRSDHVMKQHLETIDREHPNVHLRICYSRPGEKDVLGKDYHFGQRVNVDLFKQELPSNNYEFFMCGPSAFMTALTQGLKKWGAPKDKVHFEAFGAGSVAPAPKPKAATAVGAVEVHFAKSGNKAAWNAGDSNLLSFAEKNGAKIDSGCRAGSCGSCETAIREGEVTYLRDPEYPDLAEGSCLTCISEPKTNLTLDA